MVDTAAEKASCEAPDPRIGVVEFSSVVRSGSRCRRPPPEPARSATASPYDCTGCYCRLPVSSTWGLAPTGCARAAHCTMGLIAKIRNAKNLRSRTSILYIDRPP